MNILDLHLGRRKWLLRANMNLDVGWSMPLMNESELFISIAHIKANCLERWWRSGGANHCIIFEIHWSGTNLSSSLSLNKNCLVETIIWTTLMADRCIRGTVQNTLTFPLSNYSSTQSWCQLDYDGVFFSNGQHPDLVSSWMEMHFPFYLNGCKEFIRPNQNLTNQ